MKRKHTQKQVEGGWKTPFVDALVALLCLWTIKFLN